MKVLAWIGASAMVLGLLNGTMETFFIGLVITLAILAVSIIYAIFRAIVAEAVKISRDIK